MAASRGTLIVLFDGGCPVCRRTVRTLQRLDWLKRLQFADATNDDVRRQVAPSLTLDDAMRQMNVVDARGRLSGGYAAQLQIGRRVPVLWLPSLLGALPGIRQIGSAVYRHIAANRRRQGVCSDELCSPPFRRGSKTAGR
jgi:predicted DCC family thiol-disulfide oxidoreductase YuxK